MKTLNRALPCLMLSAIALWAGGCSTASAVSSERQYAGYVFTYFVGNGPGQEQIHFAVSKDGFNYRALNTNRPVIRSEDISSSGGVRDPHILRGADGKTFYMVVTDLHVPTMGWSNHAMVLMKSTDLIHWESTVVNIPKTYPEEFGRVRRVWAPQTIYDPEVGKYMVYFSMQEGRDPDIIYYAYANEDFTGFEAAPRQLYFPPADSNTRACIDGDIIYHNGKYHLFYKAEDGDPGIKLAISDRLTEGYELYSPRRMDRSRSPVEGSSVFKLHDSDEWIMMYDVYTRGRYQFTRSTDLLNFEVIDREISMDFRPRHGSVMSITADELMRLVGQWGTPEHLSLEVTGESVRTRNVAMDPETKTIRLPVRRGTDLRRLDPGFTAAEGVNITPRGRQDFSRGPVSYSFGIPGQQPMVYQVAAAIDHNPVLDGYYADPDILYSQNTGKFYIYPTSDGYLGWSGTYFKVFSSDNLVDWTDEGVILDLTTDVEWADRNAWAPCIIERKIDGQYKYFYYFTAAQKIGVAVSDSPTGPFKDSGRPLIDSFPPGVTGGQQIDPDVFRDPVSGKYYLYWGNGYMAAAELNDDMISIKEETIKVMTPDRTFREGIHVLYRNGKYYFLWSEDDTRSENYRVRYAMADSPMGPLEIPDDNLVIAKDPEVGIYGTGHNSAIQIPGRDEWYIVYHRFTVPKGIGMGSDAGFHRETCIDKLEFDAEGRIKRTRPTLEGIAPIEPIASQATGIPQYPGWKLVWHDEFDTDGPPNPDNWDFEQGFVRNREEQWYQRDNAFCQDGMLIIEGRRERKPNPTYDPDSDHWGRSREFIEYTSSSLRTRGRHAWQYGRFEIRAKIVAADGLWPAIWMLGVDRRWPQGGEIDIMEYYQGMILANVCWWDQQSPWGTHWEDSKTPIEDLIEKTGNPNWAEEFHVWRMDWDENTIRLYVDDILLNEVDITEATYEDGFNPFRQPHYMLLNLAIGGTQGGDPSSTEFPSRYKIDYVRVYQRE